MNPTDATGANRGRRSSDSGGAPDQPVRARILALAQTHGLADAAPRPLETMAEAITRLAGNDCPHDLASRALVRLCQAGVLTLEEGQAWLLELDAEASSSSEQAGA